MTLAQVGETRMEPAGGCERSPGPITAISGRIRDVGIDGLTNEMGHRHASLGRDAPEALRLLPAQGDLRPLHGIMISREDALM